jgi:hypothetical protein
MAALSVPPTLTIGTRGSALARWQTDWVQARLKAAWPELRCDLRLFQTSGDKILDKPLPEIGSKGLFTEELESALRSGEIDIAVHSLKDLPIDHTAGLTVGAIGEREDPRRRFDFTPIPHAGSSAAWRARWHVQPAQVCAAPRGPARSENPSAAWQRRYAPAQSHARRI